HAARNRVRLARGGIDEAVTGNGGAVADFASGGAVGRVERVGEAKTACDTVVEAATETNRKEVVLDLALDVRRGVVRLGAIRLVRDRRDTGVTRAGLLVLIDEVVTRVLDTDLHFVVVSDL